MARQKIQCFEADVSFKLPHPSSIIYAWLQSLIKQADYQLLSLHFIFCSDKYLHSYNLTYLQHDTFTDVITFDYALQTKTVSGEVYISIDRVQENAITYQCSFEEELYRVMVHGLLHLLGYTDTVPEEATAMRAQEGKGLGILQELLNSPSKGKAK